MRSQACSGLGWEARLCPRCEAGTCPVWLEHAQLTGVCRRGDGGGQSGVASKTFGFFGSKVASVKGYKHRSSSI